MFDIAHIDSNFKVETNIEKEDIRFYVVNQNPFKIYGVYYDNGKFRRLPEEVAKSVSVGVLGEHAHGAGGRLRFKTDSPYIAINVKMTCIPKMPHFALTGSAGFDMYVGGSGEKFVRTFVPPFNISNGYESIIEFGSSEIREITIHFPLYSVVSEMYIGLKDGSVVGEPQGYKDIKPIVYYGSSITQGGCASRPGNAYENIITRRLNVDHINLGFSGNAKGEVEMAEYISKLSMSAFVYDYDHNAPNVEHLMATHERMFNIIRKTNPDLPVIFLSRPKFYLSDEEEKRLEVIKTTYNNAKANGDSNVYIIEGPELMRLAKDDGTVDGTHPTDFGFYSMANAIGDLLEKILLG
ncbi:MAG: hypothetical protein IJ946_01245 [Clostridia bacterium]|nr:hypothetical protein [Clostridia bacterium]